MSSFRPLLHRSINDNYYLRFAVYNTVVVRLLVLALPVRGDAYDVGQHRRSFEQSARSPRRTPRFRGERSGEAHRAGGILRFRGHRGEPIRVRARKVMARERLRGASRGAPVLSLVRKVTYGGTDHPPYPFFFLAVLFLSNHPHPRPSLSPLFVVLTASLTVNTDTREQPSMGTTKADRNLRAGLAN